MLAIERRNAILEQLAAEGKVLVSDLAKTFSVTEETIRRDLEKLEDDGVVKKIYGGAVRTENLDLPFNVRRKTNVENKQYIASIIGDMISDGDYIMLDASTTALYVVKNILQRRHITLITNSIEILIELCNKPDWKVFSTGGMLKEGGFSLVGSQAEKMVSGYHVDLAVCSCKGLDPLMGVTDSNEWDSEIKKAFFSSAKKKVLAVDSSKFDKTSFVHVCDIQEIDTIVTDQRPDERWLTQIRDSGAEVLYEKTEN